MGSIDSGADSSGDVASAPQEDGGSDGASDAAPAQPDSGSGTPGDAATPMAHEWDTAGSYGGPGFGTYTCTFTVPDAPAYAGQSVFLWCGVQQASGVTSTGDTSFGVLQPVLMYGPDCVQDLSEGAGLGPGNDPTYKATPYWYYSAQYVYPDPVGGTTYQCTSGPIFKASPGDVLISTFTLSGSGATVAIAEQGGTGNSTLSASNPWDESGQSWSQFLGASNQIIIEAAIESWNVASLSEWPTAFASGWSVAASISPATGLSNQEWQLAPWDNGILNVSCAYDASTYGSKCTWVE